MHVFRVFLWSLFVLVGSAKVAFAEGDRVLLVHAGPGDPVASHLIDELVALGLTVEIAPSVEQDLVALGKARGAHAALRVMRPKRSVELWVEGSSELVLIAPLPSEGGDGGALALRVVESLRGRLLALNKPDKAQANPPPSEPVLPEAPPPSLTQPIVPLVLPGPTDEVSSGRPRPFSLPIVPVLRSPRPMRFALRVEPSLLAHPRSGGISAAGTTVVGARLGVYQRIFVDASVLVPVLPSTVESSEGRVQLSVFGAFAGGFVDLLEPSSRIGLGVGGGLGAGVVSHFGQPGTGRVAAVDGSVPYAMPYVRVGFAFRILPAVSFCADGLAAVATPRPVFRLPGQTNDVYFGQPLLSFGLGLEVALR